MKTPVAVTEVMLIESGQRLFFLSQLMPSICEIGQDTPTSRAWRKPSCRVATIINTEKMLSKKTFSLPSYKCRLNTLYLSHASMHKNKQQRKKFHVRLFQMRTVAATQAMKFSRGKKELPFPQEADGSQKNVLHIKSQY